MTITSAGSRIIVISSISVILSVMAMFVVKQTGIDLKEVRQRTSPTVLLIASFFNLLFILTVALILKFWDHQSLYTLGFSLTFSSLSFSILVLALSIGLAFIYVWYLHSQKINEIIGTGRLPKEFKVIAVGALGFGVLFIAALQEEIMFRGYFTYVLRSYGFWYSMIISTILFTLWHFITNKVNLFQSIDWMLGGIMLFNVYWLSGSIWVATFAHFGRNLANVLVFNISGSNSLLAYKKPISASNKTIYTIIYSLFIILVAYFYFNYI